MDLIAGQVPLKRVMTALALKRPIFHSEADFQFSFAQAITALAPQIQCRLERPILNTDTGRTEYLDLLCAGTDGETAIEFKYFTRGWKGELEARRSTFVRTPPRTFSAFTSCTTSFALSDSVPRALGSRSC